MSNLDPDTDKGTKIAIWIIRTNVVQTIIKVACVCQQRYKSFQAIATQNNNNNHNNDINHHFQVLKKYQHALSYDKFANHDTLNLNESNTLEELYNALEYVWNLPLIQTTFNTNNNYNPNYSYSCSIEYNSDTSTKELQAPFWVADNMEHYLYDLKRIFSSKYVPTPDDIEKCKRVCIKMEDYDEYSICSIKVMDSRLSKDPKLKDKKLHITNVTGNISRIIRKGLATFPGM